MSQHGTRLDMSLETCIDDMLDGMTLVNTSIAKIQDSRVVVDQSRSVLYAQDRAAVSQVALVTGGGSGHEPFAAGYIGGGLVAAAVAGSVFASPPVTAIETAIRAAAETASGGVLVIVFNYTGDRINFGQAVEKCRARGLKVGMFVSGDDSALRRLEGTAGRRGLCGTMFLLKIVGALAAEGVSLDELLAVCHQVSLRYSTLGVAMSGCTLPGKSEPLFTVPNGMLEVGLGVHGEAGCQTLQNGSTEELVQFMLDYLLDADSDSNVLLSAGDSLAVIVNNLGTMTQMEMLVIAKEVHRSLVGRKLSVERMYVGRLMTSLNMRGFHISLLRVTSQPEWLRLLDQPTTAPAWPTAHNVETDSVALSKPNILRYPLDNHDDLQYVDYQLQPTGAAILQSMLARVVEDVPSWMDQLNDLDAGCGDGDCGATLCEGVKKLAPMLPTLPYNEPVTLLHLLSDVSCTAMGGTSGGLYSILFGSMANSIIASMESLKMTRPQSDLDNNMSIPECQACLGVSAWVRAFEKGVDAVSTYGGAMRGFRTMLDALYPASDAASQCTSAEDWKTLLAVMSKAADEGATDTKNMIAKAGRASYVRGGKAGKEDAGARAVANIFSSLANYDKE